MIPHSRNLYMLTIALLASSMVSSLIAADEAVETESRMLQEARQVAGEMPPKLMAVLQEEIGKKGLAAAINVCQEKAPAMAKAASEKTGWKIRRVSEKNRNPKAVPDSWELIALREFSSLAGTGKDLNSLEKSAITTEGDKSYYRYIKALPTQAMCLSCHGNPEQMHPDVKSTLAALYPEDKATGYDINQIRGAITIKRPLDEYTK